MTVCGVEIKGSEAIFALASQQGHQPLAIKKIGLDDDELASHVQAFMGQLQAFVREHAITRLAVKKRSKKGEFAGGPTTFKIEGLLQLLDQCEVTLVSPQTVSAYHKKNAFELPGTLNKYQHEAYKTARAVLSKG